MTFDSVLPIYLQVINDVKRRIVNGELPQGSRFYSISELASYYRINPNNAVRICKALEAEGLILVSGAEATVTCDEEAVKAIKEMLLKEITEKLKKTLDKNGCTLEELILHINQSEKETNNA